MNQQKNEMRNPEQLRRDAINKALDVIEQAHNALPNLIAAACDRHIFKIVDGQDRVLGYQVRADKTASPLFRTADEATSFVERIVLAEIAKANRRVMEEVRPLVRPEDETDKPVPVAPGNVAPLADASVNAAGMPLTDEDEDTPWPSGAQSAKNDKLRARMKRARLARMTA